MGVDVRSRELDRLSAVEDICARASNDSVGVRVQLRFDSISHAGDAAARHIQFLQQSPRSCPHCEENDTTDILPLRNSRNGLIDLVRDDHLLFDAESTHRRIILVGLSHEAFVLLGRGKYFL